MIARSSNRRSAAFTLLEVLVGMGIFGVLMTGVVVTWSSLAFTALNTTTYAQRQNDQMRVLDYLKRDIHRATTIELYNGATLVTGTTTFASELRLTIPDYYSDAREDDNGIGTNVAIAPTVTAGNVAYGSAMTVRYYALGGAAVRNEAGTVRTLGNAAGSFTLSFKRETSGAIRCRVNFNQPLRGGTSRTLQRQIDTLCVPRPDLKL